MKGILKLLLEFLELLIIGVLVFIIVYFFVGQLLEVDGDSMHPNFHNKEQIIAEKLSIQFKEVRRGEVLVFNHPHDTERLLIKRVVGLPKETIKIENGYVYINDEKLEETYLPANSVTKGNKSIEEGKEYVIAENAFVLMGDNRENSTDSREWGAVPYNLIVGRALLVYHPFSSLRFVNF